MKTPWPYTTPDRTGFPIENPITAPSEVIKVFADMAESQPRFFPPRNRAERRAFASAKRKRK